MLPHKIGCFGTLKAPFRGQNQDCKKKTTFGACGVECGSISGIKRLLFFFDTDFNDYTDFFLFSFLPEKSRTSLFIKNLALDFETLAEID